MKVAVVGLWHLGTVTAACLASGGHDVVGLDVDADVVRGLAAGRPPLFEPSLEDLVRTGISEGHLTFTTDASQALDRADVVWVTYDTPVDDDDRADVEFVIQRAEALMPALADGALMLVSSQVPVGTTRRLEEACARRTPGRRVTFGYSPENLRLGKAIEVFTRPDRVVVGLRQEGDRPKVQELLRPFTDRIEWMGVESAEMTKHAINAFLATSVTFINEIAGVCEQVGADATEVERGLKTEQRIGPKAYLSPGAAFAGGTLARDVMFLASLGEMHGVPTHLLSSVKLSNDAHRLWTQRRVEQLLKPLDGRTVAVWGLTYKPGTDTLRRSSAVELCRWLVDQGVRVRAYDPAIRTAGGLLPMVDLSGSAIDAADEADAVVVATPWPEFLDITASQVLPRMRRRLIFDANRFLARTFERESPIEYVSVGKVAQ